MAEARWSHAGKALQRNAKRAVSILVCLGMVVALTGFNTWSGDSRLTGGVHGRTYWFDGSASSTLESQFHSAKWLWGNATSKVALAESSSISGSAFRVHQSSTLYPQGICGKAVFYTSSGAQWPSGPTSNYAYVKLLIDNRTVAGGSGCANKVGISAHELGHGLGLAHVESPTVAVMRSDIAARTWQGPQADDVAGINYLY